MAFKERDLHPIVKMIVEEEGKINTTDLTLKLREILELDEDDLTLLANRKDDRFSQVVRNLVRYNPDENGILESKGYLIDKNQSPAVFYAKEFFEDGGRVEKISDHTIRRRRDRKRKFQARKVDFEKRYEENQLIGDAGERYVLDYERDRLRGIGVTFDVLDEVVHSSKVYGDGSGYDILSKQDQGGEPLFIEVKTTKGDLNTPFFISINELSFLEEFQGSALIYRVYNFNYNNNSGDIISITHEQLITEFHIDPISYKVTPIYNM